MSLKYVYSLYHSGLNQYTDISSWVMLDTTATSSMPFTPLPEERTIQHSTRVTLSLSSSSSFPGCVPYSLNCSLGSIYLTNRRIVFLPSPNSTNTPSGTNLTSFGVPILNVSDSRIVVPWFGPNIWSSIFRPVRGGGLPIEHAALKMDLTFKEGGAPEFQMAYERIRERLQQAIEIAQARGANVRGIPSSEIGHVPATGFNGVDLANVNLEQLPAYSAAANGADVVVSVPGEHVEFAGVTMSRRVDSANGVDAVPRTLQTTPDEPPPCYEQVQRENVEQAFETAAAHAAV